MHVRRHRVGHDVADLLPDEFRGVSGRGRVEDQASNAAMSENPPVPHRDANSVLRSASDTARADTWF